MANLGRLKSWERIKSVLSIGTVVALVIGIPLFKPLGSPPPPGGSFFSQTLISENSPTPNLDQWLIKRVKYLWKDTLAFHYEINSQPQSDINPRSSIYKNSLRGQADAFFSTEKLESIDLFGPAFYASFDPVASRGFGGTEKNDWLLYVVPLKKGLRFLDLRDEDTLNADVEQELNGLGCLVFPSNIGAVFSNCRNLIQNSIRRLGIEAAVYYFSSLHVSSCNSHATDSIAIFNSKSIDFNSLIVLAEKQSYSYLQDALLKRYIHTLYLNISQSLYQEDSVIHPYLFSNSTLAPVGDSIFQPWLNSKIFACQKSKESLSLSNLISHFEFFRSRLMYRLEQWNYKMLNGKAFIKKHLHQRLKASSFLKSNPTPSDTLTSQQIKTWSKLHSFEWETLISTDDQIRNQSIQTLIALWNKTQRDKIKSSSELSTQLKSIGEAQANSLSNFKINIVNDISNFKLSLHKVGLPDTIIFFILERIFGIELTLNPWEPGSQQTSFDYFSKVMHHSAESFKTCLDIVLSTSDDSMKGTECEVLELE